MRPVTGAEPSSPFAQRVTVFLAQWNTSQMRAYPDNNQPFGPLRARRIRFRVGHFDIVVRKGQINPLLRPAINEYGLSVPFGVYAGARRDALGEEPVADLADRQREEVSRGACGFVCRTSMTRMPWPASS